jgi:polyhydroxyalkanoate synthesis regulator phasin
MKKAISQALALGLGIGITGKEKVEKVIADVEKQLGMSRKESKAFVDDMIKKGEKVRRRLDKDISTTIRETLDAVYPVSRKEFEELKSQVKSPRKRTTRRRKSAKKSAQKTSSAS